MNITQHNPLALNDLGPSSDSSSLPNLKQSLPKVSLQRRGNIFILFIFNYYIASLGPDYPYFLTAFSIILAFSIFLVFHVINSFNSLAFIILTLLVCVAEPLAYLRVALADPGISSLQAKNPEDLNIEEEILQPTSKSNSRSLLKQFPILDHPSSHEPDAESTNSEATRTSTKERAHTVLSQRYCRKCKERMHPSNFHCRYFFEKFSYCEVCIEGYDHHCPWVGKCVGKGNLKKFYLFLILTPFYLLFALIVFFSSFTLNQ